MHQRQDDDSHRPGTPPAQTLHRLLLVTDTWRETNGVTNTLRHTMSVAAQRGYDISILHPGLFPSVTNPFYPQYRHAVPTPRRVSELLDNVQPDAVHLITEGPLGFSIRRACRRRGWRFTTSFHTRWDEHGKYLLRLPAAVTWAWVRWFHARAGRVLVPTRSIAALLKNRGFTQPIVLWERGIDTQQFHPRTRQHHGVRRPILMYVGRISREKNLTDFLDLGVEGTKYVVGDGPLLATLQRRYAGQIRAGQVRFFGEKRDEELAQLYAEADVFVFPSKTDTFGNVILEALASGVPVAAYPVPGPLDILTDTQAGTLHDNLAIAVRRALANGCPAACHALAKQYTWERSTDQFLRALLPAVPAAASKHDAAWQDTSLRLEHTMSAS
jgi:glycosyltransferase involved in cell wall biosynthesis